MMQKFDICVVGHITQDIIQVGSVIKKNPGGTAYYTSMTLRRLGLKVAVVTKMATDDQDRLLSELKHNKITVFCGDSATTTVFENHYFEDVLEQTVQKVPAIAASFSPADVTPVSAPIFHLGPLTRDEIPLELLEELSLRGVRVSLDGQGFLRDIEEGTVKECDWEDKLKGLAFVDILKVNAPEARILSGESDSTRAASKLAAYGPTEVIVTLGRKGSVIFSNNKLYKIPAFPPTKLVDPTGCGDTYVAGYLYQRLRSCDFDKIGRFAAKLATLKLETFGPFEMEDEALRTLTSDLGM